MSHEDNEKGPQVQDLYLAANGESAGPLVQFFGLNIYGNWNLGIAAMTGMKGLSLMMLVVGVYEFITWSVLFNLLLLGGDVFAFSWKLTPMAMVLATLYVTVTLLWEQQMLTTDMTAKTLQIWLAFAMRLLIILMVAVINSEPVELLVFNHKIEERLQDERARAEAVQALNMEKERKERLVKDSKPVTIEDLPGSTFRDQDIAAKKTLTDDKKLLDTKEAAVTNALARLNSANARVRNAPASATNLEQLRLAARQAQTAYTNAQRERDGERDEVSKDNRDAKEADNNLAPSYLAKNAEMSSQIAIDKNFDDQVVAFIKNVKAAPTSQRVLEGHPSNQYCPTPNDKQNCRPDMEAEPQHYDTTDRDRVLGDLQAGRPPQLPELNSETKRQLASLFRFYDACEGEPAECLLPISATDTGATTTTQTDAAKDASTEAANPAPKLAAADTAQAPASTAAIAATAEAAEAANFDREERARREREAWLFTFRFWVVRCLAAVIPMFTILMKFTMRRELENYYSMAYQARHMHPEAMSNTD